ncbi:MAG: adenine phosphoribosyltransferase [Actinomycetia bacterium]|nr:adenine phosphoribosyltransferase [Actinomycetes bacterium]
MDFQSYIRTIEDWPKPGVSFKDITPLLDDAAAFKAAIDAMCAPFRGSRVTKIIGAEARGFFFASTIAYALGAGFVPARKPGKLPYKTIAETYVLEYGENQLEIHEDALKPDDRVLIVDDVLATGGTAGAKSRLVHRCGATLVGYSFFIELSFLHGRTQLEPDIPCSVLITL